MGDSRISELKHTILPLENGGEVIILDTGAIINPESEAMIQALHSRSTGGLKSHLKILAQKGSAGFISSYYVGYNHKSIGDCGTTTLFIEGISMLAAKAIQDFALYSGQEASTRYIDFSGQPLFDPTLSIAGRQLLERQRDLYLRARQPTVNLLRKLHPRNDEEDEKTYDKAINARAFDITRCLLPAGETTNVAWHANLRQTADRILFLRHHPLLEVRKIGECLETALKQHHPNSFGHKRYDQTEAYQDVIAAHYLFHDPSSPSEPVVDFRRVDRDELEKFRKLFDVRPPKTELPKYLSQIGNLSVRYSLDFGSFRDIQRHRAISQRMPLLTTELGFHQWYTDNLPEEIRDKLPQHLDLINREIDRLNISKESAQYFVPMGYITSNRFTGDIPGTVYMIELRDTSLVHPTLQKVAHSIATQVSDELNIPLHLDSNPSRFNVKRGQQDIVLK